MASVPCRAASTQRNFSRGASRGPLRARRRAVLRASFSRPHRVSECHGQRRCVALAVGFPAHQPVALGHAMAPSVRKQGGPSGLRFAVPGPPDQGTARGKGGTLRGKGPNLECSISSTYILGDFEIYRGVERNSRRRQVFKS